LDILSGSHTGSNLAKSFINVLNDFGLMDKLISITTDNASNCDRFFHHFVAYQKKENLVRFTVVLLMTPSEAGVGII